MNFTDSPAAVPQLIMVGMVFCAFALMLDYLRRCAPEIARAPISQFWAVLLLTIGGLAVRLALSPCAPYHGEGTAYEFLSTPCHSLLPAGRMSEYGEGGFSLYRWAIWIGTGGAETILMLNLILGTLCIPLLYLVSRALLRDSLDAFAAALLFALFPSLIRFSCSESFFVPLVFWWLVSLNVAIRLKPSSHWRDWALLVCALYVGINTRPVGGVILPWILLPLIPVVREAPRRLWWGLVVALGCISPVYMAVDALDTHQWLQALDPSLSVWGAFQRELLRGALANANVNPWFVPQIIPILANPLVQLSGLLLLLLKRRFLVCFSLFFFQYALLWLYTGPGKVVALYNALRFFSTTVPVACILSGVCVGAIVRALGVLLESCMGAWVRDRMGPLAVVLIVTGTLAPYTREYLGLITFAPNLEQEFRVIQRGAQSLPAKGALILPPDVRDSFHHYAPTYPQCVLQGLGKDFQVNHLESAQLAWDRAHRDELFVFIGLSCYALPNHPWNEHRLNDESAQDFYTDGYPDAGVEQGHGAGHALFGIFRPDLWATDRTTQEWVNALEAFPMVHGTRKDYLAPECAQLFETFDLVEHHVETVPNRPSQWFAIARDELPIGYYRVKSREAPTPRP